MAEQRDLEALGERPLLFISDPTLGDKYVVGSIEKLQEWAKTGIPKTNAGFSYTSTTTVLLEHDWECYDDGFELIVLD